MDDVVVADVPNGSGGVGWSGGADSRVVFIVCVDEPPTAILVAHCDAFWDICAKSRRLNISVCVCVKCCLASCMDMLLGPHQMMGNTVNS